MRLGLLLILLSLVLVFPGDNLLPNPSFEQGPVGWANSWSRDEGALEVALDEAQAHGGRASLKIEHTGQNDWAIFPADRIPVKPGDLFVASAWLKVERIEQDLNLSVVVYDAKGEVISWVYGAAETRATHDWRQVTSRWIAPQGAAAILPRLVGDGPLVAWVDDLSLAREGNVLDQQREVQPVTIDNGRLRLTIESDGRLTVEDRATKQTWRQAPPQLGLLLRDLRRDGNRAVATLLDGAAGREFRLTVAFADDKGDLTLTLSGDADAPVGALNRYPPPFASREGDAIVMPYADGLYLPVNELDLRRDFWYYGYKATMAWAGVTDGKTGYMVMLDTPYDAGVHALPLKPADSPELLALWPQWSDAKGKLAYDRSLTYHFVDDGGYVAMAKRYRRLAQERGHLRTWAEKRRDDPNVDKLLGAVNFWTRQGTNTTAFFQQLKDLGFEKAIFSLGGGWRPAPGLADEVKWINDNGYLSSHYDIYTDVWPPDDAPQYARTHGYPEDVIVHADGSLQKGWVIRGRDRNYQGYYMCSKTHWKEAEPRITSDLAENPYNCRFIDVVTASGLYECYSEQHPTTRQEDAEARADMLRRTREQFHLVLGSEESREWAMAVTDYGEGTMTEQASKDAGYDWMTPREGDPGFDKLNASGLYRIPLTELVFHDGHVSTWYTGDGVQTVPAAWEQKDLLNMLYGSMPLFMCTGELWEKYKAEYIRSYHTVCSVFEAVGDQEMTDHAFVTPDRHVQVTRFASGATVVANFGPNTVTPHGPVEWQVAPAPADLGPLGAVAWGKGWVVCRIRGPQTADYAQTDHKVFLDPRGAWLDTPTLSSDGTVLARRTGPREITLRRITGGTKASLAATGPFQGLNLRQAKVAALAADGTGTALATTVQDQRLTLALKPGVDEYAITW